MFAGVLKNGFMDSIKSGADKQITKARGRFAGARAVVFEYCAKHALIISDVRTITGHSDPTDIEIHIYCDDVKRHTKAMTLALARLTKWLKMQTVVSGSEMMINFDTITLARVFSIRTRRGISARNLINPVKIAGDKYQNLYMSPEIELIDVYHTLYDPSRDSNGVVDIEPRLFEMVKSRDTQKLLGGKKKCVRCGDSVGQIMKQVLNFATEYVVIGRWAHFVENGGDQPAEKLQLISKSSAARSLHELTSLIRRFTEHEVSVKEQALGIPKDTRTKQYTIYVHFPSLQRAKPVRKPIVDVFNCGEFELIPCRRVGKFRIGGPSVLLRFFLVEMWLARLVYRIGAISSERLGEKISRLVSSMAECRKVAKSAQDGDHFGSHDDDYFGYHIDFVISKKIRGLKEKNPFPFYPAA